MKLLNSELLVCLRQFVTAAFNRTNPANEQAPEPTVVDDILRVVFQNDGWCPICEARVTFTARDSWFRDHYLCNRCGSIPRERALMHVIATRYPNWRDLTIHESSPCNRGTSVKLAQQCRSYTASQYDPQLGFGNIHPNAGYRSENLEKQTFPDGAFDLVVTQDVFEHFLTLRRLSGKSHARLGPAGLISLRLRLSTKESLQRSGRPFRTQGSFIITLLNIMAIL